METIKAQRVEIDYPIKTKEVILKKPDDTDLVLVLKPLDWAYLRDMIAVLRKIMKMNIDQEELGKLSDADKAKQLFDCLDDEAVEVMQKLVLETLKQSYPDNDIEALKRVAKAGFMNIFDAVVSLNDIS